MVEREDAARFFSREGKNLFGKQQKQKNHHAQQEVVGVNHGKRRFACKAIQFGELTVEHASGHGDESVEERCICVAFHTKGPPSDFCGT